MECAYSAMPVGRYVLEVHGESRATWPASDAYAQRCRSSITCRIGAKDYKKSRPRYIPLDALSAAGLGVEALVSKASRSFLPASQVWRSGPWPAA